MDGQNHGEGTDEPRRRDTDTGARPGWELAAARFSLAEKRLLLQLARQALQTVTTGGALPEVAPGELPAGLIESKGCFITLTKAGRLRGCIGHLQAQEPLYRAVLDNTRRAALRDSRFAPVQSGEVDQLVIEISVLTEPQPLAFASPGDLLRKLRPHTDGVVLCLGGRSATFLPQVWEQLPEPEEFLERLALKAGGGRADWRNPEATVSTYQVESIRENETSFQ
jgi:AmmeMemoRadiSam system protein A